MSRTVQLSPEVADLAAWIEAQRAQHSYGTFGVSVTIHNGDVRKIERHATETLKPENGGRHGSQRSS